LCDLLSAKMRNCRCNCNGRRHRHTGSLFAHFLPRGRLSNSRQLRQFGTQGRGYEPERQVRNRNWWKDRHTTETVVKLTTTVPAEDWTQPSHIDCVSSMPLINDDCPCAAAVSSTTPSPTESPLPRTVYLTPWAAFLKDGASNARKKLAAVIALALKETHSSVSENNDIKNQCHKRMNHGLLHPRLVFFNKTRSHSYCVCINLK